MHKARQGFVAPVSHSLVAHVCVAIRVQEQGEADKARLKQQQEEEREANRRQHDKIQAEKALVEAALERLEIENRERADSIRQAEAAAAKTRAAELAAEEAKKRDIILQLRLVCGVNFSHCIMVHSSHCIMVHSSHCIMLHNCCSHCNLSHYIMLYNTHCIMVQVSLAPRTNHNPYELLITCLLQACVHACMLVDYMPASWAGHSRRYPGGARSLTPVTAVGTTCWRRCPCWSSGTASLPPSSATRYPSSASHPPVLLVLAPPPSTPTDYVFLFFFALLLPRGAPMTLGLCLTCFAAP